MAYMRKIFEFIEAHPEKFDASKIYAMGFSQNSTFSAYIGFCFQDKVLGVWQGGSGMSLTGQLPYLPGTLDDFFVLIRSKSLLKLWVTTFLSD